MKYVIELNFRNGVHFGSDVAGYGVEDVQGIAHSDTIFSGLINTLASISHIFNQKQWIKNLLNKTINEDNIYVPFRVSSFGFVDTSQSSHRYFIPKPLILPENLIDDKQKYEFGKEFKNRKFISIETFQKWQRNEPLDLKAILDEDKSLFWVEESRTQNVTQSVSHAAQIYHTGIVFYLKDIKPFFLLDLDEEEFSFDDFKKLMDVLKYNGLGGRRTSGCGLFDFSDNDWFCIDIETAKEQRRLNPSFSDQKIPGRARFCEMFKIKSEFYYIFSLFFPDDVRKLKSIAYDLTQRKGWSFSSSSYEQLKRKTCYMFSEGSIFASELRGNLVNVTPQEFNKHRIFRNGLPFAIPFCEKIK
ncbi:CRISPR-associated RAMP protein [Candidatus Scalindua japonica]|uniref:CRISPR system Cms protein Csm4 n=1 Tax=Candidatus Scalindua japonica TaxID=1284222 RepID=A0A286U275_9BACT|nr:type III-A CRISPR-associated RAMP protein Csm4 [Candidatus Scalindua japonica]GAX62161.1 CRISPR-associated RAMP protein [Candidatus Scalindua japonica]